MKRPQRGMYRLSEAAIAAASKVERHPREHRRSVLIRRVVAAIDAELEQGRLEVPISRRGGW